MSPSEDRAFAFTTSCSLSLPYQTFYLLVLPRRKGKGMDVHILNSPDSTLVLTQGFSFLPTLPPAELLLSGREGEGEVKHLKNS